MVDSGEKTQTEVAELFDVSKATLGRLVTRTRAKRYGGSDAKLQTTDC
jgi:predicted DNA-binding protein (UPF0251 family)